MKGYPKKAVVIGLDAPLVTSIKKYVKEGKLPTFKKLIDTGVWCENCLVPHPTITPPNWTTIVTGSWPGTHGITCFHTHKPGMRFDEDYQSFTSKDCKAEYIWEAGERVGKRSIVINYPSTWPPRMKNSIQIAGMGLHIADFRQDVNGDCFPHWIIKVDVAKAQLFSTEEYPLGDTVILTQSSWKDGGNSRDVLEAEIEIGKRDTLYKVEPIKLLVGIYKDGDGYNRMAISYERDIQKALTVLEPGKWSERLYFKFSTEKGEKEAICYAKLLELSEENGDFKLYFTDFCTTEYPCFPEGISKKLKDLPGFYGVVWAEPLHLRWIDTVTMAELIDMENTYFKEVASYLMKNEVWDMFFMHAHCPDHMYHGIINKIDPSICSDPEIVEEYRKLEENFYISLDNMISGIIENIPEESVVFIVSDHGATPTRDRFSKDFKPFSIGAILKQAGLLVTKEENGVEVIDYSKSKAIPDRSVYVYVNLKGRDPEGIVEPSEYDSVCDEIIKALYDYTDKYGRKPIVFALKKSDARIIGLYGDMVGDVIYGLREDYDHEHGRQLTTGEYGIGSIKGLLIMNGMGIKKGVTLERTVWLTDIVPTLCYLLQIPVPKECEGGIIYQALEDPDILVNRIKTLEKNYKKLKEAYEVQKGLTHSY